MADILSAVVAAAGDSRRMGVTKSGLLLGGISILERVAELYTRTCSTVVMVINPRLHDRLPELPRLSQCRIMVNDLPGTEMLDSLKLGLQELRRENPHLLDGRVFLTPGDLPLVLPGTLERLVTVQAAVVQPRYRERRGHPLLLQGSLINEILALPPEATLRTWLRGREAAAVEVEDPGVLLDLDTPADYRRAQELLQQRRKHG